MLVPGLCLSFTFCFGAGISDIYCFATSVTMLFFSFHNFQSAIYTYSNSSIFSISTNILLIYYNIQNIHNKLICALNNV